MLDLEYDTLAARVVLWNGRAPKHVPRGNRGGFGECV